MAIFLQILGALVLSVVVIVTVAILGLALKLRSLKKNLTSMVDKMGVIAMPPSINLEKIKSIPWSDQDRAVKIHEDLADQGFIHEGFYTATALNGAYVEGFHHPEAKSYACITQFMDQVVIDYFARTDTDLDITASNFVSNSNRKTPDFKVTIRIKDASAPELWTAFNELQHSGSKLPAVAGGFKQAFEEGYQRSVEFEYSSGNIDVGGIQQISNLMGRDLEEDTERYFKVQGYMLDDELHQEMVNQYLESSGISAIEWDKIEDRVIAIPHKLSKDEVLELLSLDGEEVMTEGLEGKLGTELFWAILVHQGVEAEYKLLQEVEFPVPGQIVLCPE